MLARWIDERLSLCSCRDLCIPALHQGRTHAPLVRAIWFAKSRTKWLAPTTVEIMRNLLRLWSARKVVLTEQLSLALGTRHSTDLRMDAATPQAAMLNLSCGCTLGCIDF